MKPMNSSTIRQAFLDFFHAKGHTIVPSSSLVPETDPTLLFTNAGMVQFKDILTGQHKPSFSCAASAQLCVRAGGKHNDLQNVGYTSRHHTLFEMLGNFSFGDYFKADAIAYAWEFLTTVLKIPAGRLWVTVHNTDDEAALIWQKQMGITPDRLIRLGDEDNFWAMGPTGPCGPCSEVFYDHGAKIEGGPPGSPTADGDRYVEIWNLVFMQYERNIDGTQVNLPQPCVDTGMGLERLAAVLQSVANNYDTDLFQPLLQAAALAIDDKNTAALAQTTALKVIADHIRSMSFLIADGVYPSHEGRGYVLRRIIRRALRYSHKLNANERVLIKLIDVLVQQMGKIYPKLVAAADRIKDLLMHEAALFSRTLNQGLALLEAALQDQNTQHIPGELVFQLYDTYGFPPDLTADIARERGFSFDSAGFDKAMEAQKQRAKKSNRFEIDENIIEKLLPDVVTNFSGYEAQQGESKVQQLYCGAESIPQAVAALTPQSGQSLVALKQTPFYAEAGGQAGDQGWLTWSGGKFRVIDTIKAGNCHLHQGYVEEGELTIASTIEAKIDSARRQQIRLNHSATHLLHAALRQILGNHIGQKGSLVEADRLRFDFSHSEPLTIDEITAIEQRVNTEISRNTEIITAEMPFDDAINQGAIALFSEKYSETVRVLTMADGFSMELCGGTHAKRTGDIGSFRIISESALAANVRRIEAITGKSALLWAQQGDHLIERLQRLLNSHREALVDKVENLQTQQKQLQKLLQQQAEQLAAQSSAQWAAQAEQVGTMQVLAMKVNNMDKKMLLRALDDLKAQLKSAVILLAVENAGKINMVAGVSEDLTSQIKANDLIKHVGAIIGAKGGGMADMARAGGGNPERLATALESVKSFVEARLYHD